MALFNKVLLASITFLISISSASAGLISLQLDSRIGLENSGPGAQSWTRSSVSAGVNNGALFLKAESQSLCNVANSKETANLSNCRASSSASGNMTFEVEVNLSEAGKQYFRDLGLNSYSLFYDAIAYGGIEVDGRVGGAARNTGGSANWNGRLWQNGDVILAANNRPEWSDSRRIERILSVENTSVLTFMFTASAATGARLGSGTYDAFTSFRSFVYVDPIFSVDDSIERFVDIELIALDFQEDVAEAGVNPNAVPEPHAAFLFSLGLIMLSLKRRFKS